ncbi:slipin family protein, partial [Escherichia coli]
SEVPDVLADYLRRFQPDWVEKYCLVADLSEIEAGALYMDGILLEILPPSTRRLYWRVEDDLTLVRMNTQQVQVQTEVMNAVLQPRRKGAVKGRDAILTVQVPAWHVGVLKIDGETQALLPPGLTAYWKINHLVEAEVVDTRLQVLEVSGQEILTKDKVNLRINLAANWRYSDVLLAFSQLTKPIDHLYRELQFALREAVGTRTLDELLEDKQVIDDVVSEQVKSRMLPFGMEIASLGGKDIVLPGDMKNILAQLVEAEKSAQANVIRRREETAATRSLLNTAKVMENNPVALRLKELETLERVAERIDNISVFGGLDQVLHGLVNIKG